MKKLKNKVNITIYFNQRKQTTEFILNQKIVFDFNDCKVVIPAGFRSDGCSIPKIFWSLIAPQIDGRTLLPSIKHDFLFECKLGFFKSNWYYFKELKGNLNFFKRLLILIRINFISAGHIINKNSGQILVYLPSFCKQKLKNLGKII